MEYAAKPLNQKMEYFNQHSTELQAYRNAAAYLEKESIDQSVEIDKVNVLAQEMGHRMDELVEQLRDVNLQEQKVRQERQTLAEIRSDLVEWIPDLYKFLLKVQSTNYRTSEDL